MTLEMLDVLEAGLAALGRNREDKSGPALTRESLRSQIERAGLTGEEFTGLFDVPSDTWQAWLNGKARIPAWVRPALQMLLLLSPTAKRKLLNSPKPPPPAPPASQRISHPFSRVEDL